MNNLGRPWGRQRLALPGVPPTAQPIHCGMPSSREQHHLCQCNQVVWAAPSQVQGLAAPMPQAVPGVASEGATHAVRAVHMVHQGTCVWLHP